MAKILFRNARYRTNGDLPTIGSRASDFSLVTTDLRDVSLAHWVGSRKVFNVFPSVDTEVCAKSVIAFDGYAEGHDDVAILMISVDLPFAHARFNEENKLERVTSLSAIRHAGFGENYGVEIVEGPLAGFFARGVVVLDENNTVVHSEFVEDIASEPNYAAAFQALGISI